MQHRKCAAFLYEKILYTVGRGLAPAGFAAESVGRCKNQRGFGVLRIPLRFHGALSGGGSKPPPYNGCGCLLAERFLRVLPSSGRAEEAPIRPALNLPSSACFRVFSLRRCLFRWGGCRSACGRAYQRACRQNSSDPSGLSICRCRRAPSRSWPLCPCGDGEIPDFRRLF